MGTAEIIGAVVGTVCFLIWVPCLVSWLRRGVSIPRYIHIVALATTSVGVACAIGLAAVQAATLGLSIALVAMPPALTYFGWFWLFGPESSQSRKPHDSIKCIPVIISATLTFVGPQQLAFSQQPMSKGTWAYKDGKPVSVTFDYGTKLTAKDVEHLSAIKSITEIRMGFAAVDSEYVTIEGNLLKLGRLKNLTDLHLNKDGINDEDVKFVALLPRIQMLEFNADNGHDEAPICTDRCAAHLRSAKTLRRLIIHDGKFTDGFVEEITEGLPNLEELSLNSEELTDESLRLLAERCRNLRSLSIASDHFTVEGLKHLDKLRNLKVRSVTSPALRKIADPNEILKLLGTWEYVLVTYDGKTRPIAQNPA